MGKNKKEYFIRLVDDQIIACLQQDVETIVANLKKDLKKNFYLNVSDSLRHIASLNNVIDYYGGVPVKMKLSKKDLKKMKVHVG